jgi:hypothetical protein
VFDRVEDASYGEDLPLECVDETALIAFEM